MAITTAQQAVQLQAAQAQALLAVGNVRNQANPQQNPFNWNGLGLGGSMPPLLPGTPPVPSAIYPQMAAFTAAQENATAMVAVAKLGAAKGNVSTNSALVLRNTIRKFNVQGTIFTVAQWTRKTVEENLEYLTKIVKRHAGGHGSLLLAYGDGCETILLLDSQIGTMPDDISKLKRIDIGCSIVKADCADDEEALSKQGVLQPTDSLWEHLRFETIGGSNKDDKCLFIHTAVKVYGGSIDGRRRVLQVATGAHADYKPNPIFEQQVLARWAGVPVVIAAAAVAAAVAADELEENVTLILFNPKELLLLEKAFDNRLTTRDLKAKAEKWTDEDKKAAQSVIKRANDEFVMRGPPRKRRKKDNSPEEENKAASKPPKDPEPEPAPIKITPTEKAAKSPAKKDKSTPAKKATKAKASPTKKAMTPPKADDDDDNEPISKMVKKTPSKKHSRRPMSSSSKSKLKTKSAKTPSKSEKKGRKSKESSSKKRSTSKGRSKK